MQRHGHELKVKCCRSRSILPSSATLGFSSTAFVQPMDGPDRARNTQLAIDWCLQHPEWRLSVQTHKVDGIR